MLSAERNRILTAVSKGTPMGEVLRHYWLPALLTSELPEPDCAPVRLRLLGEDLVAFRDSSGKVGILDAYCPHRRAPLFFGRNEDDGLTCIYHGWKFGVDGRCLSMPNVPPESDIKDRVKHVAYPTQECNGIIWVHMGKDGATRQLPPLDWIHLPESHRLVTKQLVECNWVQTLEGDFDPSHISFLHSTVESYRQFLKRQREPAADELPEPPDGKLSLEYERQLYRLNPQPKITVMATEYGMFSGSRRGGVAGKYYYRFNQFILPFYAGVPTTAVGPYQCNVWVPMDDVTTMVWRVTYSLDGPLPEEERARQLAGRDAHVPPDGYVGPGASTRPQGQWLPKRNLSNDYGIDREMQRNELFSGIVGVWAQDRAAIEAMGPIVDRSKERLVSSDAAVAVLRRTLLNTARALAESNTPPPSEAVFPRKTVIPSALLPRDLSWEDVANQVLAEVRRDAVGA